MSLQKDRLFHIFPDRKREIGCYYFQMRSFIIEIRYNTKDTYHFSFDLNILFLNAPDISPQELVGLEIDEVKMIYDITSNYTP